MRAESLNLTAKKLTWEYNPKNKTYYLHCGGYVVPNYTLKECSDIAERKKALESDFRQSLKDKSDFVLKYSNIDIARYTG